MPELPEVETMVRGIRSHVEGRVLRSLSRCRCRCKPILIRPKLPQICRRVVGQPVHAVRRIAKRVVFDFASGDSLVIEPRMTGLMLLSDPPDHGHLRLKWEFEPDPSHDYNAIWFWDRRGLGTVQLFTPDQLAEQLGESRLGKDALDMTLADWRRQCAQTKRDIKVALLDQRFVAGIGNLYASEILYSSGISPFRPSTSLSDAELKKLNRATRTVLTTAIRYEGSTLGDGTYRNALNSSGKYQNEHRVYAKDGQPCPRCGSDIERAVQAQRSTFFCSRCQA